MSESTEPALHPYTLEMIERRASGALHAKATPELAWAVCERDVPVLVAEVRRGRLVATNLAPFLKHRHGCRAEFANGSRLTKLGRLISTGGFSLLTLPGECTCGLDAALSEYESQEATNGC